MSAIPLNLRYTKDHEWVEKIANDCVRVGITEHAQAALGDITFVELPAMQGTLMAGNMFGVVESVKAASDLYAPVSGVVTAVNKNLQNAPELVNKEPYGAGWMLEVRMTNPQEWDLLLTAEAYGAMV